MTKRILVVEDQADLRAILRDLRKPFSPSLVTHSCQRGGFLVGVLHRKC
jgi:hypothetical protein